MKMDKRTREFFEREAKDISSRQHFSYEDAIGALTRSYQYYVDIGEEASAADGARTLVAKAVLMAPDIGFDDLRGTVDHILFSILHRAPGPG